MKDGYINIVVPKQCDGELLNKLYNILDFCDKIYIHYNEKNEAGAYVVEFEDGTDYKSNMRLFIAFLTIELYNGRISKDYSIHAVCSDVGLMLGDYKYEEAWETIEREECFKIRNI